MRLGFTLAAVLGAMALFLTTASSAWAGGYIVTAQCTTSGQTSPCNTGWYTSDVSVSWTWTPQDGGNPTDGCGPRPFVKDAWESVSCTIAGPSGQTSTSQPLHLEKSTPSIL